jgi:hypothetical protein
MYFCKHITLIGTSKMGMIPSTSARFERCDREPLDNALVEPSGTTQYQLHESQAKRYSSSEKKKEAISIRSIQKKHRAAEK